MLHNSTCWNKFLGIAMGSVLAFWANCADSQITPDSTLPNNSNVVIDGKTFNITGGTKSGSNLFHSFQEFSVPTGGAAVFNNAVDIQNIISRVTGGSVSSINGLIRASGTANLFLINPNGIIFGEDARLNIGGSFIGSTANIIKFVDGTEFSATNPSASPLLTISVPMGLQFGSNPKEITVTGVGHDINNLKTTFPIDTSSTGGLQVGEGKTLALVGGKVSLNGGILKSPAGRIEIGSVGSNQTASIISMPSGLKVGYEGINNFGDIEFSQKALVDSTGVGGGTIALTGGKISLTGQSILIADTQGNGNAGEISIVGDSINFNSSSIRANTYSSSFGGQVKLVANNISFENNSNIDTHSSSSGKAADIILKAADSIVIRNKNGIGSGASFSGDSGRIEIKANSLLIEESSGLGTSSLGQGNASDINIAADSIIIRNKNGIGSTASGAGNTGRIEIKANSLLIEESSGFGTTSFGQGNASDINIAVTSKFQLRNGGIINQVSGAGNTGKFSINANSFEVENSGINSNTQLGSTGNADEININVAEYAVLKNAGIDANSLGTGNAGNINITAKNLLIDGATVRTKTENRSNAGAINFNVAEYAVLKGVGIDTKSLGTGNAGNISISAKNLLIERAAVNTETTNIGKAGEISFNVKDSFTLQLAGVTSNTSGVGNAGKININAKNQQIENVGFSSNTQNSGKAGEINLIADSFVFKKGGIDSSTSSSGDAGKINITAKNIQIENAGVTSSTQNSGKAGEINLIADSFVLKNGGINSNTSSSGGAGKISIAANNLQIENSSINSLTENTGNAGEINIKAQSLTINNLDANSSERAGIFAKTSGSGNAGNLNVTVKTLVLNNKAGLQVESTGNGNAGILNIMADSIQLDNLAQINATSTTGRGGNIQLSIGNLLLLRRQSSISTTAGTEKTGGGDGGNITITATDGFIVAAPRENSDITANAFKGSGGRIAINATGIYGIAPLSRRELERLRPEDLDSTKLQTSDITAISQTNPNLSGTIELITPHIDPNSSSINLPSAPVDTEVAQNCTAGVRQGQSKFMLVGRGGLPFNPKTEPLSSDAVIVDWITLNPNSNNRSTSTVKSKPISTTAESIVEATGWVKNAFGEVVLITNPHTVFPNSLGQNPLLCPASK